MPGKESGYNPGDQKDDKIDDYDKELTPEEVAAEKKRARERNEKLDAQIAERKKEEAQKRQAAAGEKSPSVSRPTIKEAQQRGLHVSSRLKAPAGYAAKKAHDINSSDRDIERGDNGKIRDLLNKFDLAHKPIFDLSRSGSAERYILKLTIQNKRGEMVEKDFPGTLNSILATLEKFVEGLGYKKKESK